VETDHQSLEWLMSAKQPARLVRWEVALSEYDFIIEYRQRRLNRNADALSTTSEETSVNPSCRQEALFSIHTVTENLFEMASQRISEWIQIYLLCVDHFTSWPEAAPLKGITAKEVMDKFFSLIIARHSCPQKLLSDQGTQFKSEIFNELCKKYNINKVETTAYHQMPNGKCERFGKFLIDTISTALKKDQSDWCSLIDSVLFTYRVSLNQTLKESPFFLLYGRDPVLHQDMFILPENTNWRTYKGDNMDDYKDKHIKMLTDAYAKLNSRKEDKRVEMKTQYE